MKNCLLVIDMQNDFISGALGSNEAKEIVDRVKKRIEKAINEDEDLFFTKDTHYDDYLNTKEGSFLPVKHCIEGTNGHEICDELKEYEKNAKAIFIKNTFGYKDIAKYLEPYERITIVGLCTDICVVSNALLIKAFYPEKDIGLEKDLCAGTTVKNHESALTVMKSCHIRII